MAPIVDSIEIDRSPEDVFAHFADLGKAAVPGPADSQRHTAAPKRTMLILTGTSAALARGDRRGR